MPFAYWVHDIDPFLGPHWGNIGIRYYGLAYLLGFITTWWLLVKYDRAGRSQVPAPKVADLIVAIVFGVLLGGRLGYFVFYQPEIFWTDPLEIVRVWDGGMASHGGFIGVAIALAWFARSHQVTFLHLSDLIASATPIGLFFGRIANFINGELWGKPTDVSWAVIFPKSATPGMSGELALPRHPSQLYQAALEGLLLFAYIQWRFWRSNAVTTRPGQIGGEFLIGYAVLRMIGELFREPDSSLLMGLSRGTFYSTFMILIGGFMIRRARRVQPRTG